MTKRADRRSKERKKLKKRFKSLTEGKFNKAVQLYKKYHRYCLSAHTFEPPMYKGYLSFLNF